MRIDIYREFTDAPGGRYISEGEYSGEEFRDQLLYPKYMESISKGERLIINFDECFGFGTSFLEEAFGGIIRKYKIKNFLDNIEIISAEDETLEDLIITYVKAAEGKLDE